MHPHESTIGIHISPPSWTTPPPPHTLSRPSRLSQSTGFELSASYSKFPPAISCTNDMCMFQCYSLKLSCPLLPSLCLYLFSMPASPSLVYKQAHQYHLSRLHVCLLSCFSHVRLCEPMKPARLLCPWNFPSKNTGVCCHALFQGIFPTQGSNPCLLHCRRILYCWAIGEPSLDSIYMC